MREGRSAREKIPAVRRPRRATPWRRWKRRAAPVAACCALVMAAVLGVHLAGPSGVRAHPPRSIDLPPATPPSATAALHGPTGVSHSATGSGTTPTTTTSHPAPPTTSGEAFASREHPASGEGTRRVILVAPRRAVVVSDDAGDRPPRGASAKGSAADSGETGG